MRDIPLTFTARADRIHEHVQARGLAVARALPYVVGAVLRAAPTGRMVSYSRDKNWYTGQDQFYGEAFTYHGVVGAVDLQAQSGLIEEERAIPRNADGLQSRICATPKLLQLMAGAPIVRERERGELILRGLDKRPMLFVEDEHTTALRKEVIRRNENLSAINFTVDHPDAKLIGSYLQCHVVDKHTGEARQILIPWGSPLKLSRIFSRGSFELGGRFYADYQNVPPAIRLAARINGEAVASLDFANLHPMLLYNAAGVIMPERPYHIDGFERKDVKVATNTLINAKTETAAIKAIGRRWAKQRGGRHADRDELAQARELIGAIKQSYEPIERAFGSDAGVKLQFQDSGIALNVMRLCEAEGVPILPIHDEVLVQERHADTVEEIMATVFHAASPGPNPAKINVKRAYEAPGRTDGAGAESPYVIPSLAQQVQSENNQLLLGDECGGR
jgi:hypothetical protein